MANGIAVELGVEYSADLPYALADAVLCPGSLVLVDLAHSSNPVAGVPASGNAVPNIAAPQARALTGAASEDLTRPYLVKTGMTTANAKLERTGKGGLHGIFNSSLTTNTVNARISLPSALTAYLIANPTHSYYYSIWGRVTKTGTDIANGGHINAFIGNSTSDYFVHMDWQQSFQPSGKAIGVLNSPSVLNATGNFFRSLAQAGYSTATTPTAAFNNFVGLGSFFSWAPLNEVGSSIFYRAYLEDLTVSGRTFAKVSAIDKAAYDRAFATGGRFAGDTFTDPASVTW